MRAGADSSHRALIYDRGALLQLRECINRLSVQPPSVPSMAIISNVRKESDVTYSLLPASKRIRRPMYGIRLYGATTSLPVCTTGSRGWSWSRVCGFYPALAQSMCSLISAVKSLILTQIAGSAPVVTRPCWNSYCEPALDMEFRSL